MTDQPLNSSYLARVFNALQRARNDEQTLLNRYERLLLINQLVSRTLGFFFFVVLFPPIWTKLETRSSGWCK